MKKRSSKTKAVTDTTLFQSTNMQQMLQANGWTINQMKRTKPKLKEQPEPFLILSREMDLNTISPKMAKSIWDYFKNSQNGQNGASLQPLVGQGTVAVNLPGASSPMGMPIGVTPPPAPAQNFPAVSLPVAGVSAVPATVSTLSEILTVQRMRTGDKSFVIGFDTEFYYDRSNVRHILSWQFAFIQPEKPDRVQEILVFGGNSNRTLPFSYILNYIIEKYDIYQSLGADNKDNSGFSYYKTRRWVVPVRVKSRKGGDKIKAMEFTSYDEALKSCDNSDVSDELRKITQWTHVDIEYTDTPAGTERHYSKEVDGYPIGYINVYREADKHCVPVTLVCHTGSADLTTLDFDNCYEKDMLLRLSQIQGGLMTLKPYYMHNPVLGNFRNFYPVQLSVRDTMGFAPSKNKRLEDLGRTIDVPKLEVQKPFSKNDMLSFLTGDVLKFTEYAINDSVIALLYSAELWGVNSAMPVTVSSAAGKASVPVIKEYFGLANNDDAGFNRMYRGLHKVSKGLVPHGPLGFLENTALEPLDPDCDELQIFARNAYKGGYNGCSRVGFYSCLTNDFDLENAYPTCMSLVPDVDWENCIAFEVRNQLVTLSHVQNPFDPVFAFVDFKFPDSVRYPCIPVAVSGSMIFPRSSEGLGGVYVSAPELYLALCLGAEVRARKLIVGNVLRDEYGKPRHSLFAVVKQFVADRNIAKLSFGKKSLAEQLIKEGNNSIYGKAAQDVVDKTSWSAYSETMVDIGASQITSPYHACMTTAGVRCVLLAALNQLEDMGYQVYSVTTDGFITDADMQTLESLDLYGFTRMFQHARTMLVGDPQMWDIKHSQDDLVNLTTRGNASLIVGDSASGMLPGVMAHNSFVTGEVPDSYDDRYSFITTVLSRTGRVRTVTGAFVKFKELSRRESRLDFAVHDQERYISMDFDMKRKPIRDTLQSAVVTIDGVPYYIGNIDSEPYDTIAEYEFYKSTARSMVVLRTYEDWMMFFDKIDGKQDGKRRIIKDKEWSILFSVVMAYRLQVPLTCLDGEAASIPFLDDAGHSVQEKVDWINRFNRCRSKKFSVNTWKDCRKQTRISQMLPESLFMETIMDMMFWDITDGDFSIGDPINYDLLYNVEVPVDELLTDEFEEELDPFFPSELGQDS